jgi:hypothetical protein
MDQSEPKSRTLEPNKEEGVILWSPQEQDIAELSSI